MLLQGNCSYKAVAELAGEKQRILSANPLGCSPTCTRPHVSFFTTLLILLLGWIGQRQTGCQCPFLRQAVWKQHALSGKCLMYRFNTRAQLRCDQHESKNLLKNAYHSEIAKGLHATLDNIIAFGLLCCLLVLESGMLCQTAPLKMKCPPDDYKSLRQKQL